MLKKGNNNDVNIAFEQIQETHLIVEIQQIPTLQIKIVTDTVGPLRPTSRRKFEIYTVISFLYLYFSVSTMNR